MSGDTAEWRTTTDHDVIREWATVRNAVPTASERPEERPEIRLEAEDDARGERLSWERFFELFDAEELTFRYRTAESGEPLAESGAELTDSYELLDRDSEEHAEAKTTQPHDVESEQITTSDTGEGEPTVFDEVESDSSSTENAADADDVGNAGDADVEPTTPMSESARGSGDEGAIVVDEIHESSLGPADWEGSDEHVVFENDGEAPVDLSGWVVENEAGQSYRFPEGTTLRPGAQLTLHSGSGRDTDEDQYWNADEAVWSDQGDTVVVKTAEGDQVVTETYKGGRS